MKNLRLSINDELHTALKQRASIDGKLQPDIVIDALKAYLVDEIELVKQMATMRKTAN